MGGHSEEWTDTARRECSKKVKNSKETKNNKETNNSKETKNSKDTFCIQYM